MPDSRNAAALSVQQWLVLFDELLDALPALENVQPLCAVKSDWKISPDSVNRDATLLTCSAPHVIGDWSPNDVIALKRVTEIFFRLLGASTVKLLVMRIDVTANNLTAGKDGFSILAVSVVASAAELAQRQT